MFFSTTNQPEQVNRYCCCQGAQLPRDQIVCRCCCLGAQLTRDEIKGIRLSRKIELRPCSAPEQASQAAVLLVGLQGMESRSIRIRHLSYSALLVSNPNLLGWNRSSNEFSCTRSYIFDTCCEQRPTGSKSYFLLSFDPVVAAWRSGVAI